MALENIEAAISKLGLSRRAARAYMACLQLGTGTMTEIAKIADLKRPSAYLVVDSLLHHGLLGTVKKGAKTYYVAEPPQRLLQILRFREKELSRLMPEIEALHSEPKDKPRIKIYEGKNAVTQMYDELYASLGSKDEALFFSAIGDVKEHLPEAITEYVDKLKSDKSFRIRELNRGDKRGIEYAKKMRRIKSKQHQIRILDPRLEFRNTDTFVYRDTVVIFSIRKEIFCSGY